ncbi:MAG: AzlC family ABC transporter permease, partial [Rhodoferax sp.]|nr:AzlC family ABC transporter permease [Rhodoferax sp.]
FGFLFVQAGAQWWLAVAASVFVYAGAAQYMMIPMLAAGMSVGSIALATAVVNLRHVFYGLSLLHTMPQNPLLRTRLLVFYDAARLKRNLALPGEIASQSISSYGVGVRASYGKNVSLRLDFALVALFCVLAVEQWRSRKSSAPLWVAVASYAIAYALLPRHAMVVSIGLSVAAAVFL